MIIQARAWIRVLHNVTVTYPYIEFCYGNNSLAELIADQFLQLSFKLKV